jgi:hypothetical protein
MEFLSSHDRHGDHLCLDHLYDLYSSPTRHWLKQLFEDPQPILAVLTLFRPSHPERRLGQPGLTYLLPWSWGTVTSTSSVEELPPLSVQVIVMV